MSHAFSFADPFEAAAVSTDGPMSVDWKVCCCVGRVEGFAEPAPWFHTDDDD